MHLSPIKWSGSKRSQASEIVSYFPDHIDTYYEPFLGSASVLFELLCSDKEVNRYICSDICKPLIEIYKTIQSSPEKLIEEYKRSWKSLQDIGQSYYYEVRDKFNKERTPADFLFLTRTCMNGLIRFNQKGDFNSSLHFSRKGIHPDKLSNIITEWSGRIKNVEFLQSDYRELRPKDGDFVYADPPYIGTNSMYSGQMNYEDLWHWFSNMRCRFALSFNGIQGEACKVHDVPRELYTKHYYVYSGVSSFSRLKNKGAIKVKESLYLR